MLSLICSGSFTDLSGAKSYDESSCLYQHLFKIKYIFAELHGESMPVQVVALYLQNK